MKFCSCALVSVVLVVAASAAGPAEPFPRGRPLETEGDLATQMVAGIQRFLLEKNADSAELRKRHWKRDFSSPAAYARSIEPNRQRFQQIIGTVDSRRSPEPDDRCADRDRTAGQPTLRRLFWPVLGTEDLTIVHGDGLDILPIEGAKATVIYLPDADQTPESLLGIQSPIARLVGSGCRVIVPVLINRDDKLSLVGGMRRTNQPHREFVYRGAYEMGRHIIGFEVQKVLALVDLLRADPDKADQPQTAKHPIGIFGYGEGGLIAFYSAAADPRIDVCCVSGYFTDRQNLWEEPIYRNVWSLLDEFGDAEIASLIAPRPLLIEAAAFPAIAGPPKPADAKTGAAPGKIVTPSLETVEQEAARARKLVEGLKPSPIIEVVASDGGRGRSGQDRTLSRLLDLLAPGTKLAAAASLSTPAIDADTRQRRQVAELVEFTQYLMREGENRRREFWAKADAKSLDAWQASTAWYRDYFANEVIGRFDEPRLPLNPRGRQIYDEPAYRGYEVMLDVFPDVFAYGILLVPKGLKAGERRPVVVCQHGLEGRPTDVANPALDSPFYHRFACRLAEAGFITYAPQNPYIGEDKFRVLQRIANPLKKSLFSIIVPQHQAATEWLASLPMVDPKRIGFYGLSYGGKTAMRVPALVENYCLSICSADFNEWIWKNVSSRSPYSYLGTGEYEMVEFNLGNTFNYAEMAGLIAPRPFMVERGHHDGVAPDEWVAYEFAKVRRQFAELKIPERTTIEFFDGPHTIHGVGTFQFLRDHLNWRGT